MKMNQTLIDLEQKFGGYTRGLDRVLSNKDPRNIRCLPKHEGGDRMNSKAHQYAEDYVNALERIREVKVIVEVGILTGIGLAMWCEMFPDARVIGLDITLDHFLGNLNNLKSHGAFTKNEPDICKFDQYDDNTNLLSHILEGDTIDLCIDDGAHTRPSIIQTYKSVSPFLSKNFSYIVEDDKHTESYLKLETGHKFISASDPQLTIITES